MAQISWIKIAVNIFSDEKMQMIDQYENRDMVQNIWFKLLTLAGSKNQGGKIGFTEKKPYSTKMLTVVLNRSEADIMGCLDVLEEFEMIWKDEEGFIFITNWDKHQNIEGMEKIKEQNRERQKKYRENKKENSNVTSRDSNAIDKTRIDIDKDKEKQQTTEEQKTVVVDFSENETETKKNKTAKVVIEVLKDKKEKEVVVDVVFEKAMQEIKDRPDIANKTGYARRMIEQGWKPVEVPKSTYKGLPKYKYEQYREEVDKYGQNSITQRQYGAMLLHEEWLRNGGVYAEDNREVRELQTSTKP